VIGDRSHNGFNIGPLISHGHRDKVKALMDTVPEHGGEFVADGGIPEFGDARDKGAFIQPSVAIGSPENAPFVKQEAFGPVLHVAPFDDEEEARHLDALERTGRRLEEHEQAIRELDEELARHPEDSADAVILRTERDARVRQYGFNLDRYGRVSIDGVYSSPVAAPSARFFTMLSSWPEL
jgi:delta 1-pyrroline-5-carboxylate dehydrogenase